jgi:hypothetical protein
VRRDLRGEDTVIATYVAVTHDDGSVTNVWQLSPELSANELA